MVIFFCFLNCKFNLTLLDLLGPLCYKLITIVNCYLETGLTCFVYYLKSFVSVHFHCVAPFVFET